MRSLADSDERFNSSLKPTDAASKTKRRIPFSCARNETCQRSFDDFYMLCKTTLAIIIIIIII